MVFFSLEFRVFVKKAKEMGELRTAFSKRFREKVYPDPAYPEIQKAIARGREEFKEKYCGKFFPWDIGGTIFIPIGGKNYKTRNPSDRNITIGTFPVYEEGDVNTHGTLWDLLSRVREAGLNFAETVPWRKRARLLLEISKVVEERFWLLVAAKQYETGQSIMEAIGETDEEVDFPLAAAMYLEEIHEDLILPSPKFAGDYNGKRYVPHGVFLNVCPFNFPGAIPMDMACKALAMGNAIIEKSSNKSSLCGYLVYESIIEAFKRVGIPSEGVVNYAPGGPDVVDLLLSSPDIAGVSFTGSSEALRHIKTKHGTKLRNGYCGRAPLVFGSAETSGVNIAVVWRDADVEHAAKECLKSFIGRQGQKCSSVRVIMAHKNIKQSFISALIRELGHVRYGDPLADADVGPLITLEAEDRVRKTIRNLLEKGVINEVIGQDCSRPKNADDLFPGILRASSMVFQNKKKARQLMNTEIFGPVTTVVTVSSIDDVQWLSRQSDFALTGTSFTRNADISIALSKIIPAGNLYFNRKCTGALVETECFGGLRSASSPSGIKGKQALALFGSMPVISGFYDSSWDAKERKRFIGRMESELGFVFSKT